MKVNDLMPEKPMRTLDNAMDKNIDKATDKDIDKAINKAMDKLIDNAINKAMDKDFIAKYWYAYVYEQFENQTNDAEFLLDVIRKRRDESPQRILEVACGGGRICIPLAKAGHIITGFDADKHMLRHCYRKMKGIDNIACYSADALNSNWGLNFDIVVLAGNLLINIETDMDYALAQQTLIHKAASALDPGGHLFLDFDLHCNPADFFNNPRKSSYFEGTDDMGTYGRVVTYGSVYDPVTRICVGASHWEIETNNGELLIISKHWHKHIPSQDQVYRWLRESGLEIERTYKNYSDEPIPQPLDGSMRRASIWAKKS